MLEIKKLERKEKLSYNELDKIFTGYLNDKIDDEEMTKVLKLICQNGLTEEEIINLTDIFIRSGKTLPMNMSFIDKHSTGGVGDKTTLIVLPILASLGVRISKMSGKALGHTGGTIDKLNSIGVKTDLSKKEFYDAIDKTNMVISSQTSDLCPMDKKVYALRDVTNTTKSVPLVAASIMSKKIASGAGKILIDIKVGKGALINNKKEARQLANIMIKIGKRYDRKIVCMLTKMNNPLGSNIGNKLEVEEVVDILQNKKHNKLRTLSIEMATIMYSLNKNTSKDKSRELVINALKSGKAYETFKKYVTLQGGSLTKNEEAYAEITSKKSGYIKSINSKLIGEISMDLGAGRKNKNDDIDYDAGIVLTKNVGNKVKKGDVICRLYGKSTNYEKIYNAFTYSKIKPLKKSIIIEVIE